jgi:hypothetical protein
MLPGKMVHIVVLNDLARWWFPVGLGRFVAAAYNEKFPRSGPHLAIWLGRLFFKLLKSWSYLCLFLLHLRKLRLPLPPLATCNPP